MAKDERDESGIQRPLTHSSRQNTHNHSPHDDTNHTMERDTMGKSVDRESPLSGTHTDQDSPRAAWQMGGLEIPQGSDTMVN